MFARFDENPAMTLRVIKETKRYGRTDGRMDAQTDGRTDARTDNVKTVYPLQTKFAGGIIKLVFQSGILFTTKLFPLLTNFREFVFKKSYVSHDMRFPTMWYVPPAKAPFSLHIVAV